jgi:hypothetical protein
MSFNNREINMKSVIQRSVEMVAVLVLVAGLAACGGGDSGPPVDVDSNGSTRFNATNLSAALAALPVETPLSAAESASLVFMREEEKLAQDVYAALDGLWSDATRTFGNITNSEATHTEAVRQLLERYALADPALNQAAGSFTDTGLQLLYTQLVAAGATDVVAALQVGAQVEELDIRDIQVALATIDNQDIAMVYDNLLKGSRNHLRAFHKALLAQGASYTPQYITQEAYNAIVNSATER